MKQLTVSVCSRLWSQTLGYAITSNRIGSSELKENAFTGSCSRKVFYFYQRWLYENGYFTAISITLTFSYADYPHMAGFQYLKDLFLPNYTSAKIVDRILEEKITFKKIQKAAQYEEMVKPRLETLIHLRNSLDNDFNLCSFMPRMHPFVTNIKADYLIASHIVSDSYVFIIHITPTGDAKCDFLCCSAFAKGERDYEANQRKRVLPKKERIHIPSNTTTILFDKLNAKVNAYS